MNLPILLVLDPPLYPLDSGCLLIVLYNIITVSHVQARHLAWLEAGHYAGFFVHLVGNFLSPWQ
jgi:hypothetical protein